MPKKPTTSTGPKGVNWPALRTQYVASDDLTLRGIAEAEGLSVTDVGRHSAAEGWPKMRLARQEQDADETLRKLRAKLRGQLAERTEYHLVGIRATLGRLLDEIARGKKTGRVVTDPRTGEQVEEREPLVAGSLDKAALAAERIVKVERLILGEAETVVETRQSDEDRKLLAAEVAETLRGEGDPAEIAAAFREAGLELLAEEAS